MDRRRSSRLNLLLTACLAATACAETLDFNRDIRPILSDHCYACHGPDAAKGRKAGLRLDQAETARAVLKSGNRAIVPGDPADSELVRRINQGDPDEIMPPPEFKRPLTKEDRSRLEAWIRQGAVYQPHWAFVKPSAHAPPSTRHGDWARDPLDAFVLARIEQAGLQPSPEADRATWLRRASLALCGLQPTPEAVDAFVTDRSPDAYERKVDALLASKRCAEHLAVTWLDVARYADTAGYSGDKEMRLWPWRDWLLGALDRNLPYDQFITWQIAGDLLPGATQEQRLATAFNRLHRITFEGGSIAEEMRKESVSDRVVTFGFAFAGLTLECARCHDHKYDPVPTRDFYALAAMFSDIDENGLLPYSGAAPVPTLRLTSPAQETERRRLEAAEQAAAARYTACLAGRGTPIPVSVPSPAAHYPFEQLEKGATPNLAPGGKAATTERHRGDQLGQVALTAGSSGKAVAFDGDGGLWLDGLSGFSRHHPVTFSAWLRLGERNHRAALLHASGFYTNDADASGIELMLDDARLTWSCIQQWPGSAIAIRTRDELTVGKWVQVTVTYDGLGIAGGLRIYVDGRRADCEVLRDHLDGPVSGATLELGSRSRDSGFRNGAMDDVRLWRDELTAAEVAKLCGVVPTATDLAEHGLRRADTGFADAREELRKARSALANLLDHVATIPAMERTGTIRPTHILRRGAYDQPDLSQVIQPGAIDAILAYPAGLSRDRLGLARWVTSPDNPLTARVAVNRLWIQVFGQGLVRTPENLGLQGDPPTHPELLDQLAVDFATTWDTKAMLRRLVLSATFRQASDASAERIARDPSNLLLARAPAQRLSAEMLRDQALLAAGLIVERFGGPSVKPWQPPGLYGESGAGGGEYVPDKGEGAHRRSLYTYRKRTVPPPNQQVFDAGSREVCQVRRLTTNTPLQSLALLNDPVYFECAQALARRASAEMPDTPGRLTRAFRLVCSRPPRPAELAALTALHAAQRDVFARSPEEARKVCGAPDPELAALTLACSALLASDPALVAR